MSRASIIIILSVLSLMLISPVYAATGHVEIWGTNVTTAQANVTVTTAPQNITIQNWIVNGSMKSWVSQVTSASDTITFSIANVTPNIVVAVTMNSTPVNGFLSNSTGWVTFTQIQAPKGNATYTLQASPNMAGLNVSWFAKGGVLDPYCLLTGCTMTGDILMPGGIGIRRAGLGYLFFGTSAGSGTAMVIGTSSVFYPVQATTALAPAYVPGGIYYDTTIGKEMGAEGATGTWQPMTSGFTIYNVTANYTYANFSNTMFTAHATLGTLNITLPAPAAANKGNVVVVKKKDVSSNAVDVNVTGNCCIDDVAWANITVKDNSITLVSDGTKTWNII